MYMYNVHHTFSWVDHSMHVVYSPISVDVSVGGVVGREMEAAERSTLIQVKHNDALKSTQPAKTGTSHEGMK